MEKLKVVALEALRWAVLGAVSLFITKLLELVPTLEQTPSIELMTMVLRFADAALHKSGVAEKGVVRF